MILRDVITLVGETPAAHGVFDVPTETQRQVFCSVRSVGMREAYTAMSNGLHPELVFVLSDYGDYNGEKILLYREKQYRVIRTYISGTSIELTCEEATVDRRQA